MKVKSSKEASECYVVILEGSDNVQGVATNERGMPAVFRERYRAVDFRNQLNHVGLRKGKVVKAQFVLSVTGERAIDTKAAPFDEDFMIDKDLVWSWKDSNRCWWSVGAWPTGEVFNQSENNPNGDQQWYWRLWNEANELVWSGHYIGQLDCPPKLRNLLLDFLGEVNLVVADGVADETRQKWGISNDDDKCKA